MRVISIFTTFMLSIAVDGPFGPIFGTYVLFGNYSALCYCRADQAYFVAHIDVEIFFVLLPQLSLPHHLTHYSRDHRTFFLHHPPSTAIPMFTEPSLYNFLICQYFLSLSFPWFLWHITSLAFPLYSRTSLQ